MDFAVRRELANDARQQRVKELISGATVRAARAALRLTALDIAMRGGINRSLVALYELGRYRPPTDDFTASIASVLQEAGLLSWSENDNGDILLAVSGAAIEEAEFGRKDQEPKQPKPAKRKPRQ